jgi:hypothetical protein
MKSRIICCAVFCLLASNFASVRAQDTAAAAWKRVDTALGRSGQMQPGDVYKFALPPQGYEGCKRWRDDSAWAHGLPSKKWTMKRW